MEDCEMKIHDAEALKRAIAGYRDGLLYAFVWCESPQGYDYWDRQHEGETPLDVEALKAMLAEHEEPDDFFGIDPARFSDDELARLGFAVATEIARRLEEM